MTGQDDGIEIDVVADVSETLSATDTPLDEDRTTAVITGIEQMKNGGVSGGDVVNPRMEEVHGDSDIEIDGETDSINEDHDYSVGDIVWGKVKTHPWWPGQIHDPDNASSDAMKYKPKGRLLVAYYGDNTFAWCLPSQLIPFAKNFNHISKQNGTKTYMNAVSEAVNEINRLVDLAMTCSCVPEDNKKGLIIKTPVVNAGINPGVIAREGDIGKVLSFRYDPLRLLAIVAITAKTVSFDSILELSILKGWLSSFYRTKGGFSLPRYYDPVPIEGLEDMSKTGALQGPVEEQCTRKHRSVAKLIGLSIDITPKNRKSISSSVNKKRKPNEESSKPRKLLKGSPHSRVGYPTRYKDEEKESERITRIARVGERMTKAAVHLLDSTILKCNVEMEKKRVPIVYSRGKNVKSTTLIN